MKFVQSLTRRSLSTVIFPVSFQNFLSTMIQTDVEKEKVMSARACKVSRQPLETLSQETKFDVGCCVIDNKHFKHIPYNNTDDGNRMLLMFDRLASQQKSQTGFVGMVQTDNTKYFNSTSPFDVAANIVMCMSSKSRSSSNEYSGLQIFTGDHDLYKDYFSEFLL